MRSILAALLFFGAGGCAANFEETTIVRVRSARAVSVGAFAPAGYRELLPARGPDATVEVPASKPPLTEGNLYAEVTRAADGSVSLTCPSCGDGHTDASVIGERPILLPGSADQTRWEGDTLDIRWGHAAMFPCRRARGLCAREAMALALTTPRENVIEIRERARLPNPAAARPGAWVGIIAGSAFFAAGAVIGTVVTADEGRVTVAAAIPAVPFMLIGGVFVATGIRWLLAQDHETVVYSSSGGSKTVAPP